jgi:YD repeat-containing protein
MTRNKAGLFGNGWQTNLNLKGETNKQKTQMSFPLPDGDSLFAMKTDDGYWAVQSPNGDIYCRQTAGGYVLEKRKAWTMTYDSSLRLKTMEDVDGNKVTYQWNGDLLMKISHSDGPSLDFAYQNNRLVKITDHHGRSVVYGYSSSNLVSVTDIYGLVTSYGYAQDGALASATAPDNRMTSYQYDSQTGRVASISRNNNTSVTQFIYSGMGRVEVVNPSGNVTTIQFGTHGERLYEIDALGNRTTYQYDDQNVLKSIVYANGQVVSYDMNSDSKTESTTDAAGYATVKQYDAETGLLSRVMDVKGNLVSGFGYDDRYRMVSVDDAVGNCSVAEYDDEGNLVRKTNKNGKAISFEFDNKGRIIKKIWPDNSRIFTFEYDQFGNMTKAKDSL